MRRWKGSGSWMVAGDCFDVSSLAEEKLVDVDASSSKTISPMKPVVLSALTNHIISR